MEPSKSITIQMNVNGTSFQTVTHPMSRLLDVIREKLNLTGTKEGCGEGECGACSILLNGKLVDSCLVPSIQAQGAEILTIEGVAAQSKYQKMIETFVSAGGIQCGICTPGMIMALVQLLENRDDSAPLSEQEI